jgi:hypothetical protein
LPESGVRFGAHRKRHDVDVISQLPNPRMQFIKNPIEPHIYIRVWCRRVLPKLVLITPEDSTVNFPFPLNP